MEQVAGPGIYEFGDFRLDAGHRTLCAIADGVRVWVAPKVFDAGLYFVEHAGELLAKSQLLAHLWPRMVVEENSLTQTVCDLRRTLGELPGENRYVVTVPRRGYQFVADVRRVGRAWETPPMPDWTVAILPFASSGRHEDDDLIATGLAESILHRLACTAGIRLVAQTSSFAFKDRHDDAREIGRHLAARYLIEGSVQHCSSRLRITTQLIDTADGKHVWSLMFDRDATDLFAVEDDVAEHVARAFGASVRTPAAGGRTA
jgi:TolB-like protein